MSADLFHALALVGLPVVLVALHFKLKALDFEAELEEVRQRWRDHYAAITEAAHAQHEFEEMMREMDANETTAARPVALPGARVE